VLPSRADEGLPVVTAEAMAAGKAVIATRSGGAPEAVLDGVTGLLIHKEDVDGMSKAIARLAMDKALRCRLTKGGRERAVVFAWPTIAEKYVGVYDTIRAGRLCHA